MAPIHPILTENPLSYLSYFQGFQGKNGPPGPPGVVGPQVRGSAQGCLFIVKQIDVNFK